MRKKIAIIYDASQRPDTTGVYCRRALEQNHDVTHFAPDQLHGVPGGYDLYLNIDDGSHYLLPPSLHPSAFWAIDTHIYYHRLLSKSRTFDYVFTAQRDGTDRFVKDGVRNATWLPLACDEHVHRKHDLPKRYDICFVGNVVPGGKQKLSSLCGKAIESILIDGRLIIDRTMFTNALIGERRRLLKALSKSFENMFIGNKFFQEMAMTYSESRIVFNRSIKNDINMRVFEAAACGSLLLSNNLDGNGLSELLTDGVHYVSYTSKKELLKRAEYYLAREDERERIAHAGMEEVLRKHTYAHRMNRLLSALAESACWRA